MEVISFASGIAIASAFLAAATLIPFAAGRAKRSALSGRAQLSVFEHKGPAAALMRNGIGWLKPLAKQALKEKHMRRIACDIRLTLASRGYRSTDVSVGSLLSAVALLAFFLGWLLGSSLVTGVAAPVIAISIIAALARQAQEARRESLREAVPEALRAMSVCSHAGYSLQQTFKQVSIEVEEPLKSLFRHAVNDLETGKTVSTALDVFREKSEVGELAFVSVALDVQHRAGGSLKQVLDAARDSVESELELKRSLKVQTAQARLSSRVVSVMPFILLALFSFLSPGFLDSFFQSFAGLALLGIAVLMQVSGILLVRRMLDVGID